MQYNGWIFILQFGACERTYATTVKPYVAVLSDRIASSAAFSSKGTDSGRLNEITHSRSYEMRSGDFIEERHGRTANNPDVCWYLILGSDERKSLDNGKTDTRPRQHLTTYLNSRNNADELTLAE